MIKQLNQRKLNLAESGALKQNAIRFDLLARECKGDNADDVNGADASKLAVSSP